jgi:hypothetical protein
MTPVLFILLDPFLFSLQILSHILQLNHSTIVSWVSCLPILLSSSSAAQPNCSLTRVLQPKVCKQKAKLVFVANQMENSALKQIAEYKILCFPD